MDPLNSIYKQPIILWAHLFLRALCHSWQNLAHLFFFLAFCGESSLHKAKRPLGELTSKLSQTRATNGFFPLNNTGFHFVFLSVTVSLPFSQTHAIVSLKPFS